MVSNNYIRSCSLLIQDSSDSKPRFNGLALARVGESERTHKNMKSPGTNYQIDTFCQNLAYCQLSRINIWMYHVTKYQIDTFCQNLEYCQLSRIYIWMYHFTKYQIDTFLSEPGILPIIRDIHLNVPCYNYQIDTFLSEPGILPILKDITIIKRR